MKSLVCGIGLVAWLWGGLPGAGAGSAPPEVGGIEPWVLQVGKTNRLIVTGKNLDGIQKVFTSFQSELVGVPVEEEEKSEAVELDLFVPWDSSFGVGSVRVSTRSGISEPFLVFLDELPVWEGSEGMPVVAPAGVARVAKREGKQTVLVRLGAGQALSVEVVARRVGSEMDPVLRVQDPAGNELVYVNDTIGLKGDCQGWICAPAGGEYAVEIFDMAYGGGPDYPFYLRLGSFPLIRSMHPAALAPDAGGMKVETVNFEEELIAFRSRLSGNEEWVRLELGGGQAGLAGRAALRAVGRLMVEVEGEANDTMAEASLVDSLPATLAGQFEEPGDADLYQLAGLAGGKRQLVVKARSRSLGSRADVYLTLLDGKGKELKRMEVKGADEGTLRFELPEGEGRYLRVEELNGFGGRDYVYALVVRLDPGFALSLDKDTVSVGPDGNGKLKVTADRAGYSGRIELRVVSRSGGVVMSSAGQIPEEKEEGEVEFRMADELGAGSAVVVRVIGSDASDESQRAAVRASTLSSWGKRLPLTAYPLEYWDGDVWVGVSEGRDEREE